MKNKYFVLSIKTQRKTKKGSIHIPYEVEIRCSYEQFEKLVNKLETNDKLIQIESLNFKNNVEKISKRKGLKDLMNHNIELELTTISINK